MTKRPQIGHDGTSGREMTNNEYIIFPTGPTSIKLGPLATRLLGAARLKKQVHHLILGLAISQSITKFVMSKDRKIDYLIHRNHNIYPAAIT